MTLGPTTRLTGQPRCPNCSAVIDAAVPFEGVDMPDDGAITVCLYCLAVLVFGGNPLHARMPSGAERAELDADPDVKRARQAALAAQKLGAFPNRRGLQ